MELGYTLRNVLLGSTILGIVGGIIGSFAVLRRQSLVGDALAHAALPGVCIAFILTGSKSPWPLFLGALIAGLLGAFVILFVVRWSRIKEDSAIGIVLSVFFGVGIVLLTYIQHMPLGNQSGLDTYLFGQAAALMTEDIHLMVVLGVVVLGVIGFYFKELKLVTFNADFAQTLGLKVKTYEVILTILLVAVVVVGLRMVGVVLMVAALITPPAAARQWTDSLGKMVALSGLIGGISGVTGALVSSNVAKIPTGPVIVLVASAFLIVSILFAPHRGVVWAYRREFNMRRRMKRENLLKDVYREGEGEGVMGRSVPISHLMGARGQSRWELMRSAVALKRRGFLNLHPDSINLTPSGQSYAEKIVRKHRIWEVYLSRRLELADDHIHRDAEDMEHALSDGVIAQIDEVLGYPQKDPHGRDIPRGASHGA